MCEDHRLADSCLCFFQCGGESGFREGFAKHGDVVNGTGKAHGDAGDHGGADIDRDLQQSEESGDDSDWEDIGNERDESDFKAAEGDCRAEHGAERGPEEAAELIGEETIDDASHQHEESGGGFASQPIGAGLLGFGGVGWGVAEFLFEVAEMVSDDGSYLVDLFQFQIGGLLFGRAEDDAHAAVAGVMEAVYEIGLSASDEFESFDGGAESGWDIEGVGEGDDFEWESIFGEGAEFRGEFIDAVEKQWCEGCGDIEGDVPRSGWSQSGFNEAKGLEDG